MKSIKTMKSAKIYPFPQFGLSTSTPIDHSRNPLNTSQDSKQANGITRWKLILHWPIGLAWLLMAMLWPLLNWMGALDVVFQCVRALYYSNTPTVHATLLAELHTACYLLVSAFVYLYRPKVF